MRSCAKRSNCSRDSQTSHFRQSARDQPRLGVVAKPKSVADARGQGHHVLDGAAQLDARHVRAGVNAKSRPAKERLHALGHLGLRMSRHDSRRYPPRHFQGEGRTGERRRGRLGHRRLEQAGHGQAGFIFDALGHADRKPVEGGKLSCHLAEKFRRHGDDHALGMLDGFVQSLQEFDFRRQRDARQRKRVFAGFADAGQVFGVMAPESDGMIVLAQQIGQRRAPCSRADHGHIHIFCFPRRRSAPVRRRWMFALCL